MTFLRVWLDTPLAHALGRTLFYFLWQGALVALLLAVALYLFRSPSARVRYGLACTAMLTMLLVFGLTLSLAWPHSAGGLSLHAPPGTLPSALIRPPLSPGTGRVPTNIEARLLWLVPLWFLGVGAFALRSLASWGAAQRLRSVGVCAVPEIWQQRLARLGERVHLSKPVMLLESCLTDVPSVIGLLRPVILVPAGLLAGFPADQLECILLHELAHIRRHDYLVNLLQALVEDVLFFHPAVWWVSALIRAEREHCCDDIVVNAKGEARGLASALAALEHYRWSAREAALAANGGRLMNRIRRLVEGREAPRSAAAPVIFAGFLVASLALSMTTAQMPAPQVPALAPVAQKPQVAAPAPIASAPTKPAVRILAQAQVQPPPSPPPVAPPAPQAVSAYQKWLDEDVVYVITDEERAAFRRLQTDEERQQFILQFWLRRDPTPGTPENEYMEEHYRRMAYSNEHFGFRDFPGWKTDRGMIYIRFGPPDEIETHPAGGVYQRPPEEGGGTTTTFPFEKWRYRYIESIGNDVNMEFVDTDRSGAYHMTVDPKEKDALLNVPRATISIPKIYNGQNKNFYFYNFEQYRRLQQIQLPQAK